MPGAEPFGHQGHLAHQHCAVIGRQLEGRFATPHLDIGQGLQRIAVQLIDIAAALERRQVLARSQVLQQQQTPFRIPFVHPRHMDPGGFEHDGDVQIRAHILPAGRRIHDDMGAPIAENAKIAAKAGIAGGRFDQPWRQPQLPGDPVGDQV